MAWELRNGRRYYYRTRWAAELGRPVKEYVGTGLSGWLAAEGDRIDRERLEAAAHREKDERERLEVIVSPVLELSEVAEILTRAHLVADGYRRVQGHWRRARRERS